CARGWSSSPFAYW
nr:immunoglobulin heavy chain junction region [Mus musculus]